MSSVVQGIWAASVCDAASVTKPLYSDAGTGVIFNLSGSVVIDGQTLPSGVILLPVKKRTEDIVLSRGAELVGVRFHPAVGFGAFGKHYAKPTLLLPQEDLRCNFYEAYSALQTEKTNARRIKVLYQWACENSNIFHMVPNPVQQALDVLGQGGMPGELSGEVELSQRQIERLFKRWLNMTPKHYQRILRVKNTLHFLRQKETVNLSDIAQQFDFFDQSHMTRELREIASVTPGQV